MFKPLSLFIGLRYTFARRHFITFISWFSMIGIALGVAIMIIVLSVMNGFDVQIRQQLFSLARQVSVRSMYGSLEHWQNYAKQLQNLPEVAAVSAYVSGQALLSTDQNNQPVMINGVNPLQESQLNKVSQLMVEGGWQGLSSQRFAMVIGKKLAQRLQVHVGDKLNVIIPQLNVTPVNISPRFKRFNIVGIFQAGTGFGFDSNIAFIHLKDAQILYKMRDEVTGIHLKLHDLYQAPKLTRRLMQNLPPGVWVSNWTLRYGELFEAIKLEKTMMFLILLLLIAIASFNLISGLVMMVTEKRSDIAILRTIGANKKTILLVFVVQGCAVGFIGTLLGLFFGLIMAANVTSIFNFIQAIFHVQLLASDAYYVNFLPSEIKALDVVWVVSATLLMSFLATIYPAWQAANVHPAEALRNE